MSIDTAERERRRELVRSHLAAEIHHDLDAVTDTFAENTEMFYDGHSFKDHDSIHNAHIYMGISPVCSVSLLRTIVM